MIIIKKIKVFFLGVNQRLSKVQKLDIYFTLPPQMISSSKKYFFITFLNKTYTSLVQAILSLADGRTRSCPRSLSLTLLKTIVQNVKLDLFRHRLMVRCEENMTTKIKWTTSNPSTYQQFPAIIYFCLEFSSNGKPKDYLCKYALQIRQLDSLS